MAYDTKVLLISLAEIASRTNSTKAVYNAIANMANAEGVVLKSYEDKKSENEEIEKTIN